MSRTKESNVATRNPAKRAGIAVYGWASTAAGLPGQLWMVRDFAGRHGLQVSATFTDVGRSMRGLDRLIAALEDRRVRMVLVRTFDVLMGRSAAHALRILTLAETDNAAIISALGPLDLRSRAARLLAYTSIMIAARASELQSASRRTAARRGSSARARGPA